MVSSEGVISQREHYPFIFPYLSRVKHRLDPLFPARKCLELENRNAGFAEIFEVIKGENARLMYDEGRVGEGIMSCGQGIGLNHDIPTIKELLERIAGEAESTFSRFSR